LNSEKQQGGESLASDITSALISSDDASVKKNVWLTPVARATPQELSDRLIKKAKEAIDLLAVINANIADISPTAERSHTSGPHELLKLGDGGISLPLPLHKEWSRHKFESQYGAICKNDLDFLTKMVHIYYMTGRVRSPPIGVLALETHISHYLYAKSTTTVEHRNLYLAAMAGIIALRSTKNQDEVKKLVMTDVAVQERLVLDAVRVPLHSQILDRSEKQKLNDSRLGAFSSSLHHHILDRSEKQKLNDSRLGAFSSSLKQENQKLNFHLRFSQLTGFKEVNGHCRGPRFYKENPQLGSWVHAQRTQYRLFMEGKPSRMTQDRIKKLDDIGFHWSHLL